MSEASDLRELVDRRLAELGDERGPMSTRKAAARSDGKVSYETLRLLKLGQHSGSISQEVAEGIALALEVPLATVLKVAGRRIPQGPFVLPRRAETLTKSERAVVLSVVDAILDAAAQDRADGDPAGEPVSLRPVARTGQGDGGTAAAAGKATTTARRVRQGKERQK
jgi:hypothetical protein